ncbi:craniofacial development protein 2-like [Penaeus vannamei]|uniref:craniofacial development protein 2-like n=1 Tax=Penaeus vannamei TaxID=6689 RepID=UPI00387F58F1
MEMYNLGKKANGVKGAVFQPNMDGPSLGRAVHELQVEPDRHPITAQIKERCPLKIGSWNVRTLCQCGKLDNIKQEMTRMEINILRICETRWTQNGDIFSDEHRLIYSGGIEHNTGVYAPTTDSKEEEIEQFYGCQEDAKRKCKSQEVIIIMGDLNVKVGNNTDNEVLGKYGLGVQNERGEKWTQWCQANNQIITNTWFKQYPRRLWAWKSPGDNIRNQIDYIIIYYRFRNMVQQSKTYPGADCNSDHVPVICRLQLKLKTVKKN